MSSFCNCVDFENVNLSPSQMPLTLSRCLKAAFRHCIFSLTSEGRLPNIFSPWGGYTLKTALLANKVGNEKKREGGDVKILIRKYNLIEHVSNQMYWLM